MEKESFDLINKFDAGQTYLESYRIIRVFVDKMASVTKN
jgi:hypothetical protein